MFSIKKKKIIKKTDNHSVILFTNARDEPSIAEWIAHHLLIGFDKIVVFDHGSASPITNTVKSIPFFSNIFTAVTVVPVKGTGNIKLSLMKVALDIAQRGNYSWMLYLDADEFFTTSFPNVKSWLAHFPAADSIGVNWLMFGTSGHVSQPEGLIIENFTRCERLLNRHVKCFTRPSAATGTTNPHYFHVVNPSNCYNATGTKMAMGSFYPCSLSFDRVSAYIAHYYTQSAEEHLRRKNRRMDDGTPSKVGLCPSVHQVYTDVENLQLKHRHSGNIRQALL